MTHGFDNTGLYIKHQAQYIFTRLDWLLSSIQNLCPVELHSGINDHTNRLVHASEFKL